jgi:hypothetical protein
MDEIQNLAVELVELCVPHLTICPGDGFHEFLRLQYEVRMLDPSVVLVLGPTMVRPARR